MPFWPLLVSADWLTLEVPAEAVADLGSTVESSASELADCSPVDQLVAVGPSCLSRL